MSKLEDYFAFAKAHPELFVNPPGAGFIICMDEAEIQEAESQMAQQLTARGMLAEWAHVGIAFQDQYLMILRDAVRFPNGSLGTYTRMVSDRLRGLVILPIHQGQVLLIRHFRHATRTWHLEIPRGFRFANVSSEE